MTRAEAIFIRQEQLHGRPVDFELAARAQTVLSVVPKGATRGLELVKRRANRVLLANLERALNA